MSRRPARAAVLLAALASVSVLASWGIALQARAQEGTAEGGAPDTAIPTTPPSGVEVIHIKGKTVTAMETEVPTSVTQFDPATIAALGAQNISDLAKVTPNVQIATSAATTATFFIRGVGLSDFSANATGAVAIYQDEVAMNSPALQLGQLFDLADVNVLRGPQGAGPGRNASAGAIRIVSRKPTNDFSANLRSEFGISQEDPRAGALFPQRDFEGALQVPLIDEVLSSRFAFRFTQKDPFGKNGCSTVYVPTQAEREADPATWDGVKVCGLPANKSIINPTPPPARFRLTDVDPVEGQQKVNDTDNWAARGQLRLQPPDSNMDWLLNFHGGRLDQQSTLGQAIGTNGGYGGFTTRGYQDPDIAEMLQPYFDQGLTPPEAIASISQRLANKLDIRPYRGDYDRVGQTKLDTWGGFLRGDFELGDGMQLTAIGSFDWYDRTRNTDQDFTPVVLFESNVDDHAWQTTQDLRLSGELEEQSLRWRVGGFYLQEKLNSRTIQDIWVAGIDTAISRYTQNTWSFGVYAGFEMDFLEDFTLEAGGRYNWERKDFDFTLIRGQTGQNRRTQLDERTWDAPTGTLSLTYRFTPELRVFTKLSRGWKGGHFNASANIRQAIEPAKPETITAAETGFVAQVWDSRLDLRGNFFYYRYEDYQVFQFENNVGAPPRLLIINANDAENIGAELEAKLRPLEDLVPDLIDGFKVETSIGWLRSEFLDFTQTRIEQVGLGQFAQTTDDFSGNPLINAPNWKISLGCEWPLDFGRYGLVTPRYDGVWTDDVYFDPTKGRGVPDLNGRILPENAIGQRAHWIHNLRLAYQSPGGQMELAAFVRNVTNEIVKTYAFDARRFAEVVINFVGPPRVYGMSLSFRY